MTAAIDLRSGSPCFPMLFALMMTLRVTETHHTALKSVTLFRPIFSTSYDTNQFARFVNYYGDLW